MRLLLQCVFLLGIQGLATEKLLLLEAFLVAMEKGFTRRYVRRSQEKHHQHFVSQARQKAVGAAGPHPLLKPGRKAGFLLNLLVSSLSHLAITKFIPHVAVTLPIVQSR